MIKTVSKRDVYISYFKENFSRDRLTAESPIVVNMNKPANRLWACPMNAKYSWKDWCESEELFLDSFNHYIKFTLEEGSQILQIEYKDVKNFDDDSNYLKKYITTSNFTSSPELDYHKLLKNGIVAVQLMSAAIGHYFINRFEANFNAWDCESIVILDHSKIKILEEL